MTAAAMYLANKPQGEVLVLLIVTAVLFGVAVGWAAWQRDPFRVLVGMGLGFLTLALIKPF